MMILFELNNLIKIYYPIFLVDLDFNQIYQQLKRLQMQHM
jgi:hypothetical protein